MRRLLSSAMALLVALSVPAYSPGRPQDASTAAPSIELTISGPRLIHGGQTLKFNVTLTNRSGKPLAFRPPFGYYDTTQFSWRITDTGGRLLPPHVYDGPPVFICPLTGPVTDRLITILQPGEKMEFPYAGDPSDDYVFHGKGFYRVTLTYVQGPNQFVELAQFRPPNEKPEAYTPEQKIEMLKNQGSFEVISNVWTMYLTD